MAKAEMPAVEREGETERSVSADEVEAAIREAAEVVHGALGPGLLEHVYEVVLGHELIRRGVPVERQRMFPVRYGRIVVAKGFRADLIAARIVLVEVKSAARLHAVHRQQVLSYCRMAGFGRGLLVNFGGETMVGAVQRIEPGAWGNEPAGNGGGRAGA